MQITCKEAHRVKEKKRRFLHDRLPPQRSRGKPARQLSSLGHDTNLSRVQIKYRRYPELTPGISALFKVIYLGRKPGYSILLRHEEITKFSCKSTLRAGISGAARRRQSFSPQEPGEPDKDRRHQMRRQANSSRRRANTQKVCNGGELQREIRFPRAQVGKKASLSAFSPAPHLFNLPSPLPFLFLLRLIFSALFIRL